MRKRLPTQLIVPSQGKVIWTFNQKREFFMADLVPVHDFYVPAAGTLNEQAFARGVEHMLTVPHDAPGIDKLVEATGLFTPWRRLPDGSLALDGLTYIKLTMLTLNFFARRRFDCRHGYESDIVLRASFGGTRANGTAFRPGSPLISVHHSCSMGS